MIHEQARRLPTDLVAAHRNPPTTDPEARPAILDMLNGNPTLMAWLVFLGLGGAFLTSYYAHIHYFPVLDWKESFSYLAAILILGGGVAVVYGLLLYFPGVIWSEFLIYDTELQDYFCYFGREGFGRQTNEPCYWRIGKDLVGPFLLFMVAVHTAMYCGKFLTAKQSAMVASPSVHATLVGLTIIFCLVPILGLSRWTFRKIKKQKRLKRTESAPRWLLLKDVTAADLAAASTALSLFFLYLSVQRDLLSLESLRVAIVGLTIVVGLVLISVFSRWTFREALKTKGLKRTEAAERWLLLKYVTTADLAVASSAVSLLFLYLIIDKEQHSEWLLLLCTILVSVSNLLVAVQCRSRPRRAALTAVMSALVLLAAGEFSSVPFSVTIMQSFGLGAREGTLVVSSEGADTLGRLPGFGLKPQDRTIEGTCILSRLGSEYLVEKGPWRATIRKSDFLSWSTSESNHPCPRLVDEHGRPPLPSAIVPRRAAGPRPVTVRSGA
jgi:hypothetical protein